ncbi:MAG: helix-turn-helix domain-containing protein [Candidatus Thiodiazotropha sp. (ex Troendleina suluensis)]|nr:helix-turn-helix domain-containing protein [Candidatus Thiodiazotropha sp. (ex Troendleina suluensis)]
MQARLLTKADAADYCGMSERIFDEEIKPYIRKRLIKKGKIRNMVRYDTRHLDEFINSLPTIAPADARREEEKPCENRQDSKEGARSGTLTRPSSSAGSESLFDNLLAAEKSATQN